MPPRNQARTNIFFTMKRTPELRSHEAPTAGDQDNDQTQGQIDSYQYPDLGQTLTTHRPVLVGNGLFQTFIGRKKDMQVEQDHQATDAIHDMNVERAVGHAAKDIEAISVAGQRQGNDRDPDKGKELAEHMHP